MAEIDLDGYGKAYHVAYVEDLESSWDRVNALRDAIEAEFAAATARARVAEADVRRVIPVADAALDFIAAGGEPGSPSAVAGFMRLRDAVNALNAETQTGGTDE